MCDGVFQAVCLFYFYLYCTSSVHVAPLTASLETQSLEPRDDSTSLERLNFPYRTVVDFPSSHGRFPPVAPPLFPLCIFLVIWTLVTLVSFGLSPNSRNDANRACVLNVANTVSAIPNFLEENTFN